MNQQDIYSKDIFRPINGVIKADSTQELKDEMNWFQQGEIDYNCMNQYYPSYSYYSNSLADDFSLGSSGAKCIFEYVVI